MKYRIALVTHTSRSHLTPSFIPPAYAATVLHPLNEIFGNSHAESFFCLRKERYVSDYIDIGGLKVHKLLHDVVKDEIAPGTGVDPDAIWEGLDAIVRDLAPGNRALLQKRDDLQASIDWWYLENREGGIDPVAYKSFLVEIGYLQPEGDHFEVTTANVDPEIATIAGPPADGMLDNQQPVSSSWSLSYWLLNFGFG